MSALRLLGVMFLVIVGIDAVFVGWVLLRKDRWVEDDDLDICFTCDAVLEWDTEGENICVECGSSWTR